MNSKKFAVEFKEVVIIEVCTQVKNYLDNITPCQVYWNGPYNWSEMVHIRSEISKKIQNLGFNENYINEVLRWGGISNFRSHNDLENFIEQLNKGKLSYSCYSRISSFSKLFSFYDPDIYFILDARVSLVLNRICVKVKQKDNIVPFNPKKSRGKIVRSMLKEFDREKSKFRNLGDAYMAYNTLILSVYNRIMIPIHLPQRPELVEMALFSMAKDVMYLHSKK